MGVSRIHSDRNDEVFRRAGTETELASKMDQRIFRWFGHERIDEYRMANRVSRAGTGYT